MAGRKKQEKNRRPSSGVAVRLIIMLAVVAAIVFGVAIFFKVTTIEVQGNTLYSAEDVIAASGIEPGDNLLLVNKATTAGNILAALPYVEEVRGIVRSLPDTVVIQIQESEASFAVQTDVNTTWLVNSRGKALEKVEGELPEGQPQILGVSVKAPAAGMTVTAVEQSRLDAALAVLSTLTADNLRFAVLSEDVQAIAKTPGIGKKTAQKLILELKDKFDLQEAFEQKLAGNQAAAAVRQAGEPDAFQDAVQALTALGYSGTEALQAVKKVEITEGMDSEAVLKAALKHMF